MFGEKDYGNKPKGQAAIYTIHESDRASSIHAATNGEIETNSGGTILWRT